MKANPSEKVEALFQDMRNIEDIDGKFGRTLSKDENDVRRYILTQAPVLGRILSIDEIIEMFTQFSRSMIDSILAKLNQVDAIHLNDDKSAIVAAYPFSGTETSHLVTLKKEGYTRIYTMCAVDALGVCYMFDCDVSIESKCHHCNDKVMIDIRNKEITVLEPEEVIVWFDLEYSGCAATSCCRNINFFSSKQHFEEWQDGRVRRRGEMLQMQEALYMGRLFFENRI
ncbi:MAG: alkylmercury lyase family protein [Candidatus Hodarchaeales archaeon]|jgi:hypothetical protein